MSSARFRDPVQLAFGEPAGPSPQVRRALRRGPRLRATAAPLRSAYQGEGGDVPGGRQLGEWHEMTAGEQVTAWAGLRAWVCWLHDRYELAIEERLPHCWPLHPGLVEELYALKAWREEIYAATQPSGQAARYWHTELRQVLHAAAHQYAAGCRTGHRTAPSLAAAGRSLQQQWAAASPLAGVPAAEVRAAQQARHGQWVSHAEMAAALDDGQAGSALPGMIQYAGRLWTPVSSGWIPAGSPRTGTREENPCPA